MIKETVEVKTITGLIFTFRKPKRGEVLSIQEMTKGIEELTDLEQIKKGDEIMIKFIVSIKKGEEEIEIESGVFDDMYTEEYADLNKEFQEILGGKKK